MLVIGNGESRKGVDLNTYYGKKIGCNAIHRDYQVDHLICVDRRMVEEAVNSDVNETAIVYTRHDWIDTYKKTSCSHSNHHINRQGTGQRIKCRFILNHDFAQYLLLV